MAVALQSICRVCCSGNTGRVIWSFLPSLVAFRLVGRNSFSRLGILSSVDGVNLQCLLQPFSFTDMLWEDNHHWTPFVLVGCFFLGCVWYISCSERSGKCKKTSLPAKTSAELRCVIKEGLYFRKESFTVTIICVF